MAVHAFSSFTFSYLNRARVMAKSLRRQHPDWVLWAVMTDKAPPGFDLDLDAEDFDRLITAEELFGAETDAWLFGHDIVEASTAVKGKALQRILAEPGAERVIYFDPDIAVFNSMDPVIDLLDRHSIILTPHQLDPENARDKIAIRDTEVVSLLHGVYNLGFIAVNQSAEAHRFAAWWADRLHDWCHDRKAEGIFVDQKWCDLIPSFFEGVMVLRDPGYNVASWNLSKRKMSYDDDGRCLINGHLLRFFHFTKLGPTGDAMTRRYAKDNIEVYELWWWYRQQVAEMTDPAIPKGWWHYGMFDNGVQIPKYVRELYRTQDSLRDKFVTPFKAGDNSFHEWLKL